MTNSPSDRIRIELTARQLQALGFTLSRFGRPTRRRGEAYFRAGRVVRLTPRDRGAEAVVRGTQDYVVQWNWARSKWSTECSCPVGVRCKHAYAVGLELQRNAVPRPALDRAGTARSGLAPGGAPAEAAHDAPEAATDAAVDTPHESRPHDRQRNDVERRFARARNLWERRSVVRDLLAGRRFAAVSAFDPAIEPLLEDPDPDILCWRLATLVAARTGGPVPAALEPYRDRAELRSRFELRERSLLGDAILAWSRSGATHAPRTLRFVWSLTRLDDGTALLDVEARVSSARSEDAARSLDQMRSLLDEARRGTSGLPPDVIPVLDAYVESFPTREPAPKPNAMPRIVTPAARAVAMLRAAGNEHPAIVWGENLDPDLAARAGIEPGLPLRLAATTAEILPTITEAAGEPALDLACIIEDGSDRPLSSVVLFPPPLGASGGVVLCDGALRIVSLGPPAAILERHRLVGPVQLPAENRAAALTPLAAIFPHVRAALDPHVRTVRGTALVTLDLDEEDWLRVRVFVHDAPADWLPHAPVPPGCIVLELHPDAVWRAAEAGTTDDTGMAGMTRADADAMATAAAAAAAGAGKAAQEQPWIVEPDPALAASLRSWLVRLQAEPASRGRLEEESAAVTRPDLGWWLMVTPHRVEEVAAAWDGRPRDAQYVGNERARRLLSQDYAARPRIEIRSTGVDWFSVTADWESEGLALNEADLERLRTATGRFVRLGSGWIRREAAAGAEATLQALADLGIAVGSGPQPVTAWQLAGAAPGSLEEVLALADDDDETRRALRKLRRSLEQFDGLPEVPVPAGVNAELRPYQRRGLDFLAWTAKLGLGAVLADDMGLGKTLQALAWVQHLVDAKPRGGPTLVVCPTSVMHNWAREAERFTPGLRVLLLERGSERHERHGKVGRYDLVITNYALLRRDIDTWRETKLRAVILDEAQNIKNPDAAVSKAVFSLTATHRVALTGTPLENRPLDLWSLCRFVNPGYLGERADFAARYDRPDAAAQGRRVLSAKLKPFLLRRLKRDVATDLPERIEERRDCELTAGQRRLYLAELRRSRQLVDELAADNATLKKNRIQILAALTRLRQICCHPALVRGAATLGSGKFEAFFELLEPLLDEGHKVLVFSQFVQCLNLLEKELQERDIRHHVLTGSTTNRAEVVTDFQEQEGAGVFLISLKAGGTGLNLTAASYVVLFDPWWNPAVEAQAIDRSHRIGQDRTVIAYRLISEGTIEERIWELQQRKAEMVRDVLGDDGFARALSRDDLAFLLSSEPEA